MNSLSKNQLKNLAAYRQQKRCDEEGLFVVEGVKLCTEAMASDFTIRTACMTSDYITMAEGRHMAERLEQTGCETNEVTGDQLERLSNQRTPNKVWMLLERPNMKEKARQIAPQRLTLALDGIQDPGNMGTIMRIADWYGIRHIVCNNGTVSCFNPKAVQASMGAIFRTAVEYCDLPKWLEKQDKLVTYGAMLDGSDIYGITYRTPAVLVIGNEGHGISPDVAARIDHNITIPNIGGTCESLNAAVATAILVSEFYR